MIGIRSSPTPYIRLRTHTASHYTQQAEDAHSRKNKGTLAKEPQVLHYAAASEFYRVTHCCSCINVFFQPFHPRDVIRGQSSVFFVWVGVRVRVRSFHPWRQTQKCRTPEFQQVCICCSHINSHNQVRGHRTGSSHSGAEEYPREKHKQNQRCYTYISQLTQFMPPPETKSEIGSQPTMSYTRYAVPPGTRCEV